MKLNQMSKVDASDWILGSKSILRNISSDLSDTRILKLLFSIFFFVFGLSVLGFISSHWLSKLLFRFDPDLVKAFFIITAGINLIFILPLMNLISHFRRRKKFLDFDFAFSITLTVLCLIFYFLEGLTPVAAINLQGLGAILLVFRYFESKLWKGFSGLSPPSWPCNEFLSSLFEFTNKRLLISRFIALIIFSTLVAICLWYSSSITELLILVPSALAFFLPLTGWIQGRLFLWLIKAKARINHLSLLLEISHEGFLRFHFWGIFRKPQLDRIEIFQDPSSAWEENELLSLVKTLGEHSIHPGSQSASCRLNSLSSLELAAENIDYVGLQCSFRCPEGLLHPSVMSYYSWLKAHDHEFSVEMEQFYREAVSENKMISFLSIDKRVVLALSLESKEVESLNRGFLDLKKLGYRLGLWTSVSPSYFSKYKESLDDCASKLIPIERSVQASHWHERSDSATSVLSYWDPPESSGRRVIFQEEPRLEISDEELHFHQENISALIKIIEETRSFAKSIKLSLFIPSIWVLILFFISLEFGLFMGLFCGLLSLLILIIYFNPHFKKEMI